MTVSEARSQGRTVLAGGESPALDTDLLLAKVLDQSQSWLRAHGDDVLDEVQRQAFRRMLARRSEGEPVAYLLGQQAFWSLDLQVNRATLVPRPDTETLVELVLDALPTTGQRVADLGAGSGAIALALATERPNWQLLAVERSHEAAAVISANCRKLQLSNVELMTGSWGDLPVQLMFDAIVSNPPYIPAADPHLGQGDLRFEPAEALVSGADGLDAIREIVRLAPLHLHAGGLLALEHGYDQGDAVTELLADAGFSEQRLLHDLGGHPRVSTGRWPG